MEVSNSHRRSNASTLSLVGAFLCLTIVFGGLVLTAVAAHQATSTLAGVAIVLFGPTLTFGLVFVVGRVDHLVRRRFTPASSQSDDTVIRKQSPNDAFQFMKMLFLRLSTILALGLLAALLYAFIGTRNGGVLIGAGIVLLAIIGSIFRR